MDSAERFGRLGLTLLLAVYGFFCLRNPETWRWLDGVDLVIHEAGHLVFAFGGRTLHLLGGTILQLIFPLAFVWGFLRQGDPHSATVPLWWAGQSCWNVSVYVGDARLQRLPLVGGGEHDWAILLGNAGLLSWDETLSRVFHFTGVVFYVAAVGWGLHTLHARQDPDGPAR